MLKVTCLQLVVSSPESDLNLVGEALVRYVNSGVTLGAVNMPEVNLRSLTLDERDHARVSDNFRAKVTIDNDRLSISIATFRGC